MVVMRSSCSDLVVVSLLLAGCSDPIELEDSTDDADGGGTDSSPGTMTGGSATITTTTGMTITTTSPTVTTTPPNPSTATVSITEPTITADGTESATGGPDCPDSPQGPLENGEMCTLSDQCASGVCVLFTDAPPDPDGVCEPRPFDCSMRITGTVLDIVTQQPVTGADMIAAAALEIGLDPTGATPWATATSGDDGRVDTETFGPIEVPIGLSALTEHPDYSLTATGLAAPWGDVLTFPAANDVHDLWIVSEANAATWSNLLALDPEIDPAHLPLGDQGGVVGLVRDAAGVPLANAVVTSEDGMSSSAQVRYVSLNGTLNDSATSSWGLFMIVDPALAEVFEVSIDGIAVGSATVGSANGVIFTLVVTAS